MKKRHVIVLVAALSIGLLVFLFLPSKAPPDPKYQGEPLSFWVQQELRSPTNWQRLDLTPEASEAVRQIGTNAIPFLFGKIRYRDNAGNRIRQVAWRFGTIAGIMRRHFAQRLLMPIGYN